MKNSLLHRPGVGVGDGVGTALVWAGFVWSTQLRVSTAVRIHHDTRTKAHGVHRGRVRHDAGARFRMRCAPQGAAMLRHMHGQGPTRRRFQSFCGHFKIGLRIFGDFYI